MFTPKSLCCVIKLIVLLFTVYLGVLVVFCQKQRWKNLDSLNGRLEVRLQVDIELMSSCKLAASIGDVIV